MAGHSTSRHPQHDAWRGCAERAYALGLQRQIGAVAADGIAVVPSTTTEDACYEVRMDGGAAISCGCLAGRTRQPCVHRAALALALWERRTGRPLEVRAVAGLVSVLISAFLEPALPPGRPAAVPGGRRDHLPELRPAGAFLSPAQERAGEPERPCWW